MAEISDDQLKLLNGSKALLDKLLNSPKTRRATEKLIKEHYPETETLEDVAQPYFDEVKELRKELKEFTDKVKGDKLDDRLETEIKELRSQDWTDDGIDKLKKLMVDRQIPSIKDAALVWNGLNPPPKPQEPSILAPTDWGFGRKTEDADLKLLFEDEDAWAEKEAQKAWSEESAKRGQIIT